MARVYLTRRVTFQRKATDDRAPTELCAQAKTRPYAYPVGAWLRRQRLVAGLVPRSSKMHGVQGHADHAPVCRTPILGDEPGPDSIRVVSHRTWASA